MEIFWNEQEFKKGCPVFLIPSSKWKFWENRVPFTHSYQFQAIDKFAVTQKFQMAHNFQELYECATCHVTSSNPIGFINHHCEPYLNGKFDLYILKLACTGAEIAIYL